MPNRLDMIMTFLTLLFINNTTVYIPVFYQRHQVFEEREMGMLYKATIKKEAIQWMNS